MIIIGYRMDAVLGHLLFLLYINYTCNLCNVSDLLKIIHFEDDTNIFYSNNDINNLQEVIKCNNELKIYQSQKVVY